ncbi:MAG TPA: NAD(P)/FAD-dependent oxidoreductase [Candidatus Binatus sp.]|uniref:NAD(P)/FAD-dependent oxidoreductase n=1 Tax=Candidatus Binatus sp. TaxID=2811406 RepID=UPI002B48B62B|nr:NAD(P)/FAD-dependent oxidoreductase [Candidatus Binatus sp.]HKN12742.1 NAD(P)/FAD-dependent oxidoreductase [Candidatus Binatus sp.]
MASSAKHVVIIGGGFGGIAAARALKHAPVRLTMIDRRNHHLFQPLLYQVATAALNPSDIASPIRRILRRQGNASVILGEAVSIDTRRKIVQLADGEVAYDYLIVASGATHSYFGHDEWLEAAPGLKTLEDAVEIRRRVLVAYEAAEREVDAAEVANWMTFVIIGAGPTGVEMAGALAEISRRVLERDFRTIDPGNARIILIEAGPRVLPAMSPESSASARRQLERLGVEVITDSPVTAVDDRGVMHGGARLDSRTVIWAAGVAASPLGKTLGADVKLDRAGRVIVNQDLLVPAADSVFVIGDLASISSDGKPVPGLSPAAMQEGRHAARNVTRLIHGEPTLPFHYRDKGTLATIGKAAAVADIAGLHLSGLVAWLMWLFVHIFFLIGFRNRFIVIVEWAWTYVRNDRGARLITGNVEPMLERGEKPENRKRMLSK